MCLDMIGKSDMNSKLRDKTRLGIKKQMTVFNVVKELRHGSEWCNAAVRAEPCTGLSEKIPACLNFSALFLPTDLGSKCTANQP